MIENTIECPVEGCDGSLYQDADEVDILICDECDTEFVLVKL